MPRTAHIKTLSDGTVCVFQICTGVKDKVENLNLPAGQSNVSCAPVPAGEMYEVEAVGVIYTGTVTGVALRAQIVDSAGVVYTLGRIRPPVSGEVYPFLGRWTMNPGDFVTLLVTGATLNDDGLVYFVGRKYSTS